MQLFSSPAHTPLPSGSRGPGKEEKGQEEEGEEEKGQEEEGEEEAHQLTLLCPVEVEGHGSHLCDVVVDTFLQGEATSVVSDGRHQ